VYARTQPNLSKVRWTQIEFARFIRRDPAVISKLIKRGILTQGADWITWIHQFIDHYEAVAAGRSSGKLNLADERARLAQMQTARIGFELARARSEFVARAAIAHEICASFAIVRSRLLSLPTRVHSQNSELPTKVFTSIEAIIRECLEELARTNLPPAVIKLVQELNETAFQKACEDSEAAAKRNGSPTPKSAEADKNESNKEMVRST
jgi:signal transduction histidine kinase